MLSLHLPFFQTLENLTKRDFNVILFIGHHIISCKEMITIIKRTVAFLLSLSIIGTLAVSACAAENYDWAKTEIEYCQKNNIMTGDEHGNLNPGSTLTRAEMAKMLTESFNLKYDSDATFADVSDKDWYSEYAKSIKASMTAPGTYFYPNEAVTREEFAATLVLASGLKASSLCNLRILSDNFYDADKVSTKYKTPLSVAVERAYYRGTNYYLRPTDTLKRAEVCAMLYRVLEKQKGYLAITRYDLGIPETNTPLMGKSTISQESAIAWAKANNASDLFIDAAQYYWKYGELTGIRPEVLYAQAAKETGYGRYGGRVLPEMNNFAGIKKYGATGDATEDHETFATREDGVRGHFNHMSSYVGIDPIGEVHGRYNSVKTLAWAGTVKYVEDLGGRWCPDLYYGYAIVKDLLNKMENY